MKMSFRWYGESDPISLEYIRQIPNMHSIVSAVYDVKPGEVWPEESLKKMKEAVEAEGMLFDVVESIPVHEDIKLGRGDVDKLLEVYCENVRRCAKYGVKCVTYNFMPVFDWTRTQLDKAAPDGSTSLVMYWDQMRGLDPLKDDIHLPGWDSSYTQDEVRELITAYGELGAEGLWANLDRFLAIVDSPANSLCLCTGSLGCAATNDVVKMVKKYAAMDRIAFMHMRQVLVLPDGSFEEQGHLSSSGSLDMYEITKALVDEGFDGYVRPDHGRMIWGETGKPGYGLYDRALGATYINGLFEALEKELAK